MASPITGTVRAAFGFTTPTGESQNHTIGSTEYEVIGCFVTVDFNSGTYVQAQDATFNPQTVIQNSLRSGKTITVLQAAFASAGNENGAIIGAGACTVATNLVTCPLLLEDLATERGASAMSATWNRPVCFFVAYKEPINGE